MTSPARLSAALAATLLLGGCSTWHSFMDWMSGGRRAEPVAAAPAAGMAPGPSVNGLQYWFGPRSAAATDMQVTARDSRSWDIMWQLVGQAPPGPFPAGGMAVAVFAGPKPSAGYAIEIVSVEPTANEILVTFHETAPSAAPMQADAARGAPYALRLVEADLRPVRFVAAP